MERDLNDVPVFLQVVESRSFTGAAKVLHLPPSSVSRRVARLERALGVQLLQRTTRKVSLTEAGRLYYEQAQRGLAEIRDAEHVLAEAQATPRGRVKVLAPAEHDVALRLVTAFLAAHPEVRVDLEFTTRDLNIIAEGFDAALLVGPITNLSLVAHKLLDSPMVIVASPEYLETHGTPRTPSDLTRHACLVFGASSAKATWTLRDGSTTVDIAVAGPLAANHMLAVRDAARAGLGLAQLPRLLCRHDLASGALVPVLAEAPPDAVPLWIARPDDRYPAPAVRAFIAFVREHFAAHLASLSDA